MNRNAAHRDAPPPNRRSAGFTMIELTIAILVIGVLVAVAYPTFIDSVRKSRRTEAVTALAALQQAQERWRSNNASYTTDLGNSGLKQPATTAGGYYTIAVTSADAASYVATATPVSGTSQGSDAACTLFVVAMQAGGNVSYGSNSATLPLADANRCWAR